MSPLGVLIVDATTIAPMRFAFFECLLHDAKAIAHKKAQISQVFISLENVKEHAPPLAGASVETGNGVHNTGDVADRAASGGCCGSPCSAS